MMGYQDGSIFLEIARDQDFSARCVPLVFFLVSGVYGAAR